MCQGVSAVLGWVVAVVAAGWSALALAASVVVGRVVRLRDRQVPAHPDLTARIPEPRGSVDPAADRDLERG